VAKKVRDKEPVLEILVRIGGRYWKLSRHWRANHTGL